MLLLKATSVAFFDSVWCLQFAYNGILHSQITVYYPYNNLGKRDCLIGSSFLRR